MEFTEPWKNSDQVLVVEERDLHVHRCVLSLCSPVFDRMFNSDFKEKTCKRIELPEKKYDELVEMLQVIYDRRKEITDDNFCFLLSLADEFQIDQLRDECIKHIRLANKTGITALKYMNVIKRFDIKDLDDECLTELQKIPNEEIIQNYHFEVLHDSTKLEIITERAKYLERVISQHKKSIQPFVEYIYNRAYDGYVKYLHDQGLQESMFTICEKSEKHVNKRMGQNFDFHCESCRKRVKIGKKFAINTKEISDMLERLYISQYEDETEVLKRDENLKC